MIRLGDLKSGDIVMVNFEGQQRTGDVTEISSPDKKVKVAHGDQEFWYDAQDVFAIPIDNVQLEGLGFRKLAAEGVDGELFERGPFSIQFVRKGEGRHVLLHYRDETRHISNLEYLHQLQNHYKSMTNFVLSWPD